MDRYHVIEHWRTAASDYPRRECDGWSIRSHVQGEGQYRMQGPGAFYYVPKSIELTQLYEGDRVWFDDSPRNMYALAEIGLFRAHGRVIVGGLGLGLIHWFLRLNPNVTDVVTIERAGPVVSLVWPDVKFGRIRVEDFYAAVPSLARDGYQADCIYTDFIFGSWNDRTWAELEAQRAFCREHYPDALFLEHGYQARMDAERVEAALPSSLPFGTPFDTVRVFR